MDQKNARGGNKLYAHVATGDRRRDRYVIARWDEFLGGVWGFALENEEV